MEGQGDWAAAYSKAQAFVRQLTLLEKVNLTTGVGWEGEAWFVSTTEESSSQFVVVVNRS
jgi:hypothetical protein